MGRFRDEVRTVRSHVKFFGWQGALALLLKEKQSRLQVPVALRTSSLTAPFVLRTHSDDLGTFEKVIAYGEYDLPELEGIRTIVDAGANIGMASIFFAKRFPGARIIALEPEPSNFELLVRNLAEYPNVVCLRKALWTKRGRVTIFDPGIGTDAFRASGVDGAGAVDDSLGTVECVSILDLLAEYSLSKIDLLKVDIEGAEKEVFESADAWIDRVDAIVIELHDRFKRGCSRAVYNATTMFQREIHKGENVFLLR
jgi:FkbM family methyltransferase